MKGASNIVSAIQHLRMADDHFLSFINEHFGSKGARLFMLYRGRIHWIWKDLLTHPFLTDEVRAGIKKEVESDVFAVPAITEKIALLAPGQREILETIIDELLSGKEIKAVKEEKI